MILSGKRILVVEDEYFIASDLQRILSAEGAEVVGPAGDLAAGIGFAQQGSFDAAILDVNLCGAVSYPIIDQLRQSGTPLLLLTGYDEWAIPEAYRDTPRIAKPFSVRHLLSMVAGLCSGSALPSPKR